jgi:hypothetical protein
MYHLSSIIHHLHLSSFHILYLHPSSTNFHLSSIVVGTCIKAARLCVVVVFVVVEERATP